MMALLTRTIGKTLSKTTPKEAAAVARKRAAKFMGMVDEVKPASLPAPTKTSAKKSGVGALAAGALAATAMATSDGGKQRTSSPKGTASSSNTTANKASSTSSSSTSSGASSSSKTAPSSKSSKTAAPSKSSKSGLSSFGKAFKDARSSGVKEFSWNGKRYNTRQAGETASDHADALKKIKSKNSEAFDKKIQQLQSKK